MATCYRCRKETGMFGGFNKQTGRCGKCDSDVKEALDNLRTAFINYCSDGLLTNAEWGYLVQIMEKDKITKHEAMAFIRNDAINFVERSILFASADGYISDQEEQAIQQLINGLEIPPNLSQPILKRMAYLKALGNIRQGNLPVVQSSVRFDVEEKCHLEVPATYFKVTARSTIPEPGRLIVTNRVVLFVSPSGGNNSPIKNIFNARVQNGGIYLEASKKSVTGFYSVPDPSYTEAIIDTLIRISRREILVASAYRDTKKVPQEIKIAVYQRDKGRCVECGMAYALEYDHIIPRSKGGATSVENLQLLCRPCNLKKGDRI